jgi:hypothetical protein
MAMRVRVENNFAKVTAAVKTKRGMALAKAGLALLEDANRTVPIEEGTLMRSGGVSVDAGAGEAAVSYDTPYAVRQHEDERLSHDAGRRAKWLERSLQERGSDLIEMIGSDIGEVL